MTAPKTQKAKSSKTKKTLLTVLIVLVVLGILVTAGYFSKSQYLRVDFSFKDKNIHHTTYTSLSTLETVLASVKFTTELGQVSTYQVIM